MKQTLEPEKILTQNHGLLFLNVKLNVTVSDYRRVKIILQAYPLSPKGTIYLCPQHALFH